MADKPTLPGWYPHPKHPGKYGFFNGRRWTTEPLRDEPPVAQPRERSSGTRPPTPTTARPRRPTVAPATLVGASLLAALAAGLLIAVGVSEESTVALVVGIVVGAASQVAFFIGAAACGALLAIRYERGS